MRYSVPIPHARGFQPRLVEQPLIPPSDAINDLFLHALFARIATQSGLTHEFKTDYNKLNNTLELDIPENVISFIESVGVQVNLQRFIAWLVQSSGLITLTDTDSNGVTTVGLAHIVAKSFAYEELINNSSGLIDWSEGNKQTVTAFSDLSFTFLDPRGPTALQLVIRQDIMGGRNATWPANIKWPNGGISPVLTPTANAVDILSLVFDGDVYYGTLAKNFA